MRHILLPLLLLGTALPAAAETSPAPAAAAATFTPRLNPPLDRPLAYRLTKEKVTKTSEKAVFDQEVTFSRLGDGYAMSLRWLRLEQDGKTFDLTKPDLAGLPATVRPFVLPMTIELDPDGRPLRLRDWPRYQKALADVVPLMAQEAEPDPKKRPAAEEFFRCFLSRYTAMSAENAAVALVTGWPQVLAEFGHAVPLGRAETSVMAMPSPFADGVIDYRTTSTWTRDPAGTLNLVRQSAPTPEATRALVEGMARAVEQSAPKGGPVDGAAVRKGLAGLKARLANTMTFDGATGLPREAVLEKFVTLPTGEGTERITLTAQ